MPQVTRHNPISVKGKENMAMLPSSSKHENDPMDEVIEDSEPEREERRRKLKAMRTACESGQAPPLSSVPININPVERVTSRFTIDYPIEVLDDSVPSIAPNVVEEIPASTAADATSTTLPSLDAAILEPACPVPVGEPEGECSVAMEPGRAINIAHFAYQAPRAPSRGRASSPISVTSSVSSIRARPLSTSASSSKWPSCPLPESKMKKISKCPCCDLSWTARKATSTKWEHIRKCAKKNEYTPETVQTKLEQQIEASADGPDGNAKPKKRKPTAPVEKAEAPKPDTLLERITHEAAPPKRTKKQVVVATVQTISQAHQLIAEKARNLFDDDNLDAVPAQLDDSAAAPRNPFPPATQAFVPSKFGGAPRNRALLTGSALEKPAIPSAPLTDSSPDVPLLVMETSPRDPPRPKEAPLAQANATSSMLDLASTPTTVSRNRRSSSPKKRLSLRQMVRQEDSIQDSDDDSISSGDDGWVDEAGWGADAVLQWDGDASDGSGSSSSSVALSKVARKTTGKGKDKATELADEVVDDQPKKRGRKKKDASAKEKEPKMTEEEMVEMVEKQLRAMIEEDEELYLRILRYEPMKFDYLLKLAIDRGIPERKLKQRLRVFLDKQCINFYTADPTGPRRRH